MNRRRCTGLLRGLSGLLAGGLVALVAGLCVAWALATHAGSPGPGAATIGWYGVAAAFAALAQRYADRHPDGPGTAAAAGVIAISVVALAVWLLA